MGRLQTKIVRDTLPDSNWNTLTTVLGLPDTVRELEMRNATAAFNIRNIGDTSDGDLYAKDEVYGLDFKGEGTTNDISNKEIKGAGGDVMIVEYSS